MANVDATVSGALAEKYGVQGYPTIKFFPAGSNEPVAYEGGRSEEDFLQFLNEKCGAHRVAGGGLAETAGRISELDVIAAEIKDAAADAHAAILAKAKEVAKSLDAKSAQ